VVVVWLKILPKNNVKKAIKNEWLLEIIDWNIG
jgi:hypothetical protein